ncbi:hypothetical protein SBOR_1033 [Sclerotinia borealis F-4128]|uniref:Uncharacterized protein n=1 Tax=Sclerotinia borealis (strain F-4128) TaxID=1432307 RepID=W9CR66_SCLBF|nr:hypothetical protein SBOR_1033 [Sclerotinia borealis F-4128]
MSHAPPPNYKESLPSPSEFVNIELRPIGAANEAVRTEPDFEFYKPSKRTARRCYLIPILILIVIIAILGGMIAFLVTNPGVIGKQCPIQANVTQYSTPNYTRIITRTQIFNTTTSITQSITKTRPAAQATSTHSGVDPVAIATCLGVLENACAMDHPPTTFGQCDPLFVFFYCDLTDKMVFRGAMELDADGSSPVCQPMKEFCSRAIPLNKIPLADVSP